MTHSSIITITYIVLTLVAIWCFWKYRRLPKEFRLLVFFVWMTFIVQVFSLLLAKKGINNMALSHVYAVLSFLLLLRFYRFLLRPFINTIFFSGLSVGFLLLAIVNAIFWEPLTKFNSIPLTLEAAVMIILTLSTFWLTLNDELNDHIRARLRSINWINSGIFLYFTGSLLLFYNGETIIHSIIGRWSVYTWMIHAVLFIMLHIFLLIGLWLSPKT